MISDSFSKIRKKSVSVKIIRPFKEFLETQKFSGILLIICTFFALFLANSPMSHEYFEIWETDFVISLGVLSLSKPLHLWINDGLMAIFFFVVGLEVKRELLVGELNTSKKAILPISAAIGGMLIPVIIYRLINLNNPSAARGWGIPMATDIAFVVGILALLGPKMPLSLKIFLTSLAIVDDMGAVLIIALFYSQRIEYIPLIIALIILLALIIISRLNIQNHIIYAFLGVFLWYFLFNSGIHATIAGILVALTIPAKTKINPEEFLSEGKRILERFSAAGPREKEILLNRQQLAAIKTLEITCLSVETPLQRLERGLHFWVAYLIMPLFIIANAGISFTTLSIDMFLEPITLGIIFGLVIGKQVGIFLFTWIIIKMGLSELPSGLTWGHIYGASWLGGIGFTMSLFIASLALVNPVNIVNAKLGILTASIVSGMVGYLILTRVASRIAKISPQS